jgi:nucleotide-binding universal stress UspA family protein
MIRKILLAYNDSETEASIEHSRRRHEGVLKALRKRYRGHGLLDRWRLGSVTHRVISYADCAVTVVR